MSESEDENEVERVRLVSKTSSVRSYASFVYLIQSSQVIKSTTLVERNQFELVSLAGSFFSLC